MLIARSWIGLFLMIFVIGCGSEAPKVQKQVPMVKTKAVRQGRIAETLEINGNVVATKQARLGSPAEGPIRNLRVREGDFVKNGAPVLTIGRTESADAQMAAAEEDFKRDQQDLQATEKLVKNGALPAEMLDRARSAFSRSKAQLIKARETMDDFVIRAPWSGYVSKVLVTDGNFVAPRTLLVEMFDPASLVVQFALPEKISVSVARDSKIFVTLDAYPDKSFSASISSIYPDLDLKTRSRTVEATLKEKTTLMPGMFARLKIELKSVAEALIVPAEAVLTMPGGEKVVYLVKEEKAVKHKVRTGIENGPLTQLLDGVAEGDQVIVEGHERLKDGVEVRLPGEKKGPGKDGGMVQGKDGTGGDERSDRKAGGGAR
jgi:RND family efflux transporter MFP subunit